MGGSCDLGMRDGATCLIMWQDRAISPKRPNELHVSPSLFPDVLRGGQLVRESALVRVAPVRVVKAASEQVGTLGLAHAILRAGQRIGP